MLPPPPTRDSAALHNLHSLLPSLSSTPVVSPPPPPSDSLPLLLHVLPPHSNLALPSPPSPMPPSADDELQDPFNGGPSNTFEDISGAGFEDDLCSTYIEIEKLRSKSTMDFTLRGLDSFIRMGTTSLFSTIWFSVLSVVSMHGWDVQVPDCHALIGVYVGFMLAILLIAFAGALFLWLYGSFWTTLFIILLGGLAFTLRHEQVALLITTVYSMYCAWGYVGWMGVLLGLYLSFISSDCLIYILKKNVNQNPSSTESPEETPGMHDQQGFFNAEHVHASSSENGPGYSADRSPRVASTSGTDSELTSDDEIVRLLNCTDHYAALGFTRYEDVDITLLKREYKKKAMLVHPDKNMGNEKAAYAFKKLQNAYEVLLDSLKRKTYDDELRSQELLNIFRRFKGASQKVFH